MYNRSAIMRSAWNRYRQACRSLKTFDRDRFREALRLAWVAARQAVVAAKAKAAAEARASLPAVVVIPPRVMTPLEAALDAVKYLPAHMSAARAEARILAAYA